MTELRTTPWPRTVTENLTARLVAELREHALVLGKVTLTSGAEADYNVDVKRATLRHPGFGLMADLVLSHVLALDATAVGGLTMGADPIACAALSVVNDIKAFFVRKEAKAHGLQRRIEGPPLTADDRVLVVEDVVTSGGSTITAIDALTAAGIPIVGVVTVLDRLAGGEERIRAALPGVYYAALATIDDVYPERTDK